MLTSLRALILGISLSLLCHADINTDEEEATTLQGCAKTLPKGQTYTLHIIGTIDTHSPTASIEGTISVIPKTSTNSEAKHLDDLPFAICAVRLIKEDGQVHLN